MDSAPSEDAAQRDSALARRCGLPVWSTAIQLAMTEMRVTKKPRSARSARLPDDIRHGNIELRHLRYFVVVAEELNLRRAAGRLEISQPAVTKQVARLEEQMGVSLFARARHRLAGLTSAGTDFPCRGAPHQIGR